MQSCFVSGRDFGTSRRSHQCRVAAPTTGHESLKSEVSALMFICDSLMRLPAGTGRGEPPPPTHPDVAVTWHDPSLSCACREQIRTSVQFGGLALCRSLYGSELMQMRGNTEARYEEKVVI